MKASCSMPSLVSIAEREVAMPLMTTFHPRRIPNSSSAFRKVRSETDLHSLDKGPQFHSHSPKLAIKSKHTSVESEAHTNPTRMGGFGITGGNGRGHSNKKKKNNGGDRDKHRGRDRDAYYQKMLEAHPGDPLLLRNYAGYLYEVADELDKAEEYYERAVLENPGDGDVLAMYAKFCGNLETTHSELNRISREPCRLPLMTAMFWVPMPISFGTQKKMRRQSKRLPNIILATNPLQLPFTVEFLRTSQSAQFVVMNVEKHCNQDTNFVYEASHVATIKVSKKVLGPIFPKKLTIQFSPVITHQQFIFHF